MLRPGAEGLAMGVVVTIAVVLVAWCVLALVVGVVVGRAIALRPQDPQVPRGETPEPGRAPSPGASLSVSYRERI
jgi:hypothetical protein